VRHKLCATLLPFLVVAFSLPVQGNAQIVRDSSGVRIVHSVRPATGRVGSLQLSGKPRLELRPDQGPQYTFDGIAGVVRLSSEQ
jgi:hypothetical protein